MRVRGVPVFSAEIVVVRVAVTVGSVVPVLVRVNSFVSVMVMERLVVLVLFGAALAPSTNIRNKIRIRATILNGSLFHDPLANWNDKEGFILFLWI